METELRVGTLGEVLSRAAIVARAADERRPLVVSEGRQTILFETQDDVNDALASAWLHRYHERIFQVFPSFAKVAADPLAGFDAHVRRQMARGMAKGDAPWRRRDKEGGVDTIGTIAIAEKGTGNLAVLVFGLRLAMEHLAFLTLWTDPHVRVDVRMMGNQRLFYEFDTGRGRPPLGMYVQMQPQDERFVEEFRRVRDCGGEVVIVVPKTLSALDGMVGFPGGTGVALPWAEMSERRLIPGRKGPRADTRPLTPDEIALVKDVSRVSVSRAA
ncbi:MAG: hypothetical protein ACYDEV_00070 [Acidiferrobacter sp.]